MVRIVGNSNFLKAEPELLEFELNTTELEPNFFPVCYRLCSNSYSNLLGNKPLNFAITRIQNSLWTRGCPPVYARVFESVGSLVFIPGLTEELFRNFMDVRKHWKQHPTSEKDQIEICPHWGSSTCWNLISNAAFFWWWDVGCFSISDIFRA